MARYIVIENTPGYLPEDDEPGKFGTFRAAAAHAKALASELRKQGYYCKGYIDGSYTCYRTIRPGKLDLNDLGRVIEVISEG